LEPAVAPPPGIIYRTGKGLWRTNHNGDSIFLVKVPGNTQVDISPDGNHASYLYEASVLDLSTGQQTNLDSSDDYAMCCPRWWPARPDVVLVQAQPGPEMMGMGFRSIPAAVNLDGTHLRLLGNEPTSIGPFAPSPDGLAVAYDQAGVPWIYEWDVGARPFDVAGYGFPELDDALISHPAWSHSGERLAWIVGSDINGEWLGGVGLFDLKEQTSQFLYPYDVEGFDGGRSLLYWSPDEKHLVIDNFGKELWWMLAVDGTEEFFSEEWSTCKPTWSPDGRWLACWLEDSEPGQWKIWVMSTDGVKEHQIGAGTSLVWSPSGEQMIVGENIPHKSYDYWLVDLSTWQRQRLDLPQDAVVLEWLSVDTIKR
jgi:Tol biopolymer transport system component